MDLRVHEEVLNVAREIAARNNGIFRPQEVVRSLPHLNKNSVLTHITSRCCVNAPPHHQHRWAYFRRVGSGKYELEPSYRGKPGSASTAKEGGLGPRSLAVRRDTIHAYIQRGDGAYVAECLEIAVVTQGRSLDDVVENLRQAIALHLDGEDMAELGLSENPRIQLVYEVPLAS